MLRFLFGVAAASPRDGFLELGTSIVPFKEQILCIRVKRDAVATNLDHESNSE